MKIIILNIGGFYIPVTEGSIIERGLNRRK